MHYTIPFLLILISSLLGCAQTALKTQPQEGPGGNQYPHSTFIYSDYHGSNKDSLEGFFIFEPTTPKLDTSPVIVFVHGLGQNNPMVYGKWLAHLCKKGYTIIYPRYQSDGTDKDAYLFTQNTAGAIRRALDTLRQKKHAFPDTNYFALIGNSYGGQIAANLAAQWEKYRLPKPKALMTAQGYMNSSIRPETYATIPAMHMLCVVGANDKIASDTLAKELMSVTNHIPKDQKHLVIHQVDKYRLSRVKADHASPLSLDKSLDTKERNFWVRIARWFVFQKPDVVDFNCYWKLSTALLDCAFYSKNCAYAFGNTAKQQYMGAWSDKKSIKPLIIE